MELINYTAPYSITSFWTCPPYQGSTLPKEHQGPENVKHLQLWQLHNRVLVYSDWEVHFNIALQEKLSSTILAVGLLQNSAVSPL